jgi:hypothetical protein
MPEPEIVLRGTAGIDPATALPEIVGVAPVKGTPDRGVKPVRGPADVTDLGLPTERGTAVLRGAPVTRGDDLTAGELMRGETRGAADILLPEPTDCER